MSLISPMDSRYLGYAKPIRAIFGEEAQIKEKYRISASWLNCLRKVYGIINTIDINYLRDKGIEDIKEIEKKTKHDIKAIINYLESIVDSDSKKYVHFGLTSEDIVSMALASSMVYAKQDINKIISKLKFTIANSEFDHIIPAYTHGQKSVTTNFDKEMIVFLYRINMITDKMSEIKFGHKFGGAIGNLSGLKFADPSKNWVEIINGFCKGTSTYKEYQTTQVSSNIDICIYLDYCKILSTILIDLCRDLWMYGLLGYISFNQEVNQIGSSTMPQKSNPVIFENAEGNLKISISGFELITRELIISRLQRDLSNSTLVRNIGLYLSHFYMAIENIIEGYSKITVTPYNYNKAIADTTPALLMENVQLFLRFHDVPDAYEICRKFSQGKPEITESDFSSFIDNLKIDQEIKTKLYESFKNNNT